jgi:hypothetical protein
MEWSAGRYGGQLWCSSSVGDFEDETPGPRGRSEGRIESLERPSGRWLTRLAIDAKRRWWGAEAVVAPDLGFP